MKNTYRGVLDLDGLSTPVKLFNWFFCYHVATVMAIWGCFRAIVSFSSVSGNSLDNLLISLAVLSPTSIAIGWLRLTGVRWIYALSLFIFVPGTALGTVYLFFYLIALLFND
jgi:hypothetical protein